MLTVSNYHYIRNDFNAPFPSIYGVTLLEFENQMQLLKSTGVFINPNDLIANVQEILLSKINYILITFDDGLKEQYESALPILNKLNIPALFFINTINHIEEKVSLVHKIHLISSIIGTTVLYRELKSFTNKELSSQEIIKAYDFYRFDNSKSAEFKYFLNVKLDYALQEKFINKIFLSHFDEKKVRDELYMNTEELKELIKLNYIGSHTHSHLPLALYDLEVVEKELHVSKIYLERLSNTIVDFVSYPYGTIEAVTEMVAIAAKKEGYKFGFTTKSALNIEGDDYLLLNRFDCNDLIGGKNYK